MGDVCIRVWKTSNQRPTRLLYESTGAGAGALASSLLASAVVLQLLVGGPVLVHWRSKRGVRRGGGVKKFAHTPLLFALRRLYYYTVAVLNKATAIRCASERGGTTSAESCHLPPYHFGWMGQGSFHDPIQTGHAIPNRWSGIGCIVRMEWVAHGKLGQCVRTRMLIVDMGQLRSGVVDTFITDAKQSSVAQVLAVFPGSP